MRFLFALLTATMLTVACKCPPCPSPPDAAHPPDLVSVADLATPPDMAHHDPCVDTRCDADADCLPSYCRCSTPAGGTCSAGKRCVFPACASRSPGERLL